MNKCDWNAHFALFSQFVTCLGRIVHHSPSQPRRCSSPTLLTLHLAHRPTTEGAKQSIIGIEISNDAALP